MSIRCLVVLELLIGGCAAEIDSTGGDGALPMIDGASDRSSVVSDGENGDAPVPFDLASTDLATTDRASTDDFGGGSPDALGVAPLRTLWVDHDSHGGTCSDTYSAVDNAQSAGSKPFCTLAAAAKVARAGDLVTVRGGTYSEKAAGTNFSSTAVMELVKRGTVDHPIVYRAYAGETPVIDPNGQVPPSGLLLGLVAGMTKPVGLCTGTTTECMADSDCGGAAGSCDRGPSFHTVIDGFHFRNWSFYDTSPTATNNNHVGSQYAVMVRDFGLGTPTDITFRNCEFDHNNGGGALHFNQTARITFEYNRVHDNHTHGWTTALNFFVMRGAQEGPNRIHGNVIYNNEDDPPLFCLPAYCGGDTSLNNRCSWDKYTNTSPAAQGYGCGCGKNADCQSNQCITRDCSSATGGCECAGDTEGHGVIFDVAGANGAAEFTSNVIWGNEGTCINAFKSDNITIENNTCYQNNIRPATTEISAFTNHTVIFNNIVVPRTGHAGLGLYYNTFVYTVDPTTNAEGYNLIWASDHTDVFEWGFGHHGALAQYLSETAMNMPPLNYGTGTLSEDPKLVNPGAHDFHLAAGSPAIASGDNAHHAPTDVAGTPYAMPDRGAFVGP